MVKIENQVIDLSARCIWGKEKSCKVKEGIPCPSDCSLLEVPFEKEAIISKMRYEESEIHRLRKDGMWKNKEDIRDRAGGIMVMQNALKEKFSHIEPHVIEKDGFEKDGTFIPKKGFGGWRR